ncbi:MAG: DMT family transporter [Psychromonas sp.]
MHSSSQFKFILLAVISASCMGTIGALARYANLPAEQITFYRLFLGAICLLLYMVFTDKSGQILHRPSKRTFINGVMLAGFMVFYIQAMNYTSMANVVMLVYLAPLLSAAVAHYVFAEKLKVANLLAIAMALLGFAMVMQFSISLDTDGDEYIGMVYAILALLSYSAFMLMNRRPSDCSEYHSTLVQLLAGALCLLPFVLATPQIPTVEQSLWLLCIGFLPGFIAILCAVKALRHLPSVTFGTVAYIEPIVVVALAWWLFSETLNLLQLTGCLLIILAGIGQGILSQNKPKN